MYLSVNWWAVLAGVILSMVIGSIWYGPVFGKIFMNAMGMNEWSKEQQEKMKKAMAVTFITQFAASLVTVYVLAVTMNGLGYLSPMGGLQAALLVWIGFIVPLKLGDAIWGGKMILFWLGIGETLLTLLVAGVIIGWWS